MNNEHIERIFDAESEEPTGRHRLQLDFSPKTYAILEGLRLYADAPDRASMIEYALRVYRTLADKGRANEGLHLTQEELAQLVKYKPPFR